MSITNLQPESARAKPDLFDAMRDFKICESTPFICYGSIEGAEESLRQAYALSSVFSAHFYSECTKEIEITAIDGIQGLIALALFQIAHSENVGGK